MRGVFFFFFKQKTAYEMLRSLVGSEMCIRDRCKAVMFRGGIPRPEPCAGGTRLVHIGGIESGPRVGPAGELLGAIGFTRRNAEVLIGAETAWPRLLVGNRSCTGGDETQQDRAVHVRTSSKAHAQNWASRKRPRTRTLRVVATACIDRGNATKASTWHHLTWG